MENKEVFLVAGKVLQALTKAKMLDSRAKEVKQEIFEALRPALEAIKVIETDSKPDLARMLANDPEYARSWLTTQLADAAKSGNTQAAKELRDILNIANRTDELQIEVVNYVNAIIDCPHCGGNVHKPITETESKQA